jgi:hypothetical protein
MPVKSNKSSNPPQPRFRERERLSIFFADDVEKLTGWFVPTPATDFVDIRAPSSPTR